MTPAYINYRFTDVSNDTKYEYANIWFDGKISGRSPDNYYSSTGSYTINFTNFDRFGL